MTYIGATCVPHGQDRLQAFRQSHVRGELAQQVSISILAQAQPDRATEHQASPLETYQSISAVSSLCSISALASRNTGR